VGFLFDSFLTISPKNMDPAEIQKFSKECFLTPFFGVPQDPHFFGLRKKPAPHPLDTGVPTNQYFYCSPFISFSGTRRRVPEGLYWKERGLGDTGPLSEREGEGMGGGESQTSSPPPPTLL